MHQIFRGAGSLICLFPARRSALQMEQVLQNTNFALPIPSHVGSRRSLARSHPPTFPLSVSPHPTTHHLILRAQRFRAALVRGDHVQRGFREVEGRAQDTWFHLFGEFCAAIDFPTRAFHTDHVAVADALLGGVQGIDEQQILTEDFGIPGSAGHVAAVVVGEFAVGGEDVGIVAPVSADFVGFFEGDEREPALSYLECFGMENLGSLAVSP